MKLTYEQAKELGLKDQWPTAVKVGMPETSGTSLNKLETEFLSLLERGPFTDIESQSIKFRLAGRTWYTPDFVARETRMGNVWVFEVKGFMRDDAVVKLKVAASMYPWLTWILVTKGKLGWKFCCVTKSSGLSKVVWSPDW